MLYNLACPAMSLYLDDGMDANTLIRFLQTTRAVSVEIAPCTVG
jgi:hypothetical protein